MDERLQLTLPLPIGGQNFEVSENLLQHVYSPDMLNTLIEDGDIIWRPGMTQVAAGYPNDASPVMAGVEYGDASGNLHVLFVDIARATEFIKPSTWTNRTGALLFTGNSMDIISIATVGGLSTENLYITNGRDPIKVWTGSGNWANLTTTGFTTLRGKCIAGFRGHLLLGDVTENSNLFPYRVRWSTAGNPTTWNTTTAGFVNLIEDETNSKVMCMHPLKEVLIAYKFGAIYQLQYQGDPNYFVARMRIADRGAISRKGVAPFGDLHLVVSQDNIHVFDGLNFIDPPPGNRIKREFFKELNWERRERIFTKAFPGRFEVWIAYPAGDEQECKTAWCWNYKDGTWTHHEFLFAIYSFMNFNEFFDRITPTAGGLGKVYKFMDGLTDDGIEIPAHFRTKLYDYGDLSRQAKTNLQTVEKTMLKVELDSSGDNPGVQVGYVNNIKKAPTYTPVEQFVEGNKGRNKADVHASGQYLTVKVIKNEGDEDFRGAQVTTYVETRGTNR